MRSKLFPMVLLVVAGTLLFSLTPVSLASQSEGPNYAGTWVGTYSNPNSETNNLSFTFSKDEKGQWGGTVKFTNQDGEQTVAFKSLQFADGKMKGVIESPDGQVEVTIEGQFAGDKLEGTYAVSPKGSTEVNEKGTLKVAKSSTPK
jgi:hypothetical protein